MTKSITRSEYLVGGERKMTWTCVLWAASRNNECSVAGLEGRMNIFQR